MLIANKQQSKIKQSGESCGKKASSEFSDVTQGAEIGGTKRASLTKHREKLIRIGLYQLRDLQLVKSGFSCQGALV